MSDSGEVFVYVVDVAGGTKHYVSPLPTHVTESTGLQPYAIYGRLTRELKDGEAISPKVFTPNPAFVDFLHTFIAEYAPKDTLFRKEVERSEDGWVYVIDARTPTPDGDVPPEDIIGGFQVEDGELVPESYNGNTKYVVLTEHGFTRLTDKLQRIFIRKLGGG